MRVKGEPSSVSMFQGGTVGRSKVYTIIPTQPLALLSLILKPPLLPFSPGGFVESSHPTLRDLTVKELQHL